MRGRHATIISLAGTVAVALSCEPGEQTPEAPQAHAPTSFSEAKARAADSDKLLLVDFYASW